MTNTIPAIGEIVSSAEAFNLLPIGATLRDEDGWVHTKIADAPIVDGRVVFKGGDHTTTYVSDETGGGSFYRVWGYQPTVLSLPDVEVEAPTGAPEAPSRPLIDFSGDSRATAREYAEAANSRVLKPESQADLKAVALGMQVDAYDLNEAVLDAMRSASTRLGQSMARRDLTRKIAYLGHIVQAVLENHADGLPAYESGDRSRLVEAMKADRDNLQRELLAETERRKGAESTLEEVKATLAEGGRLLDENTDSLELSEAAVNVLAHTLDYAKGLLAALGSEQAVAQVDGYLAALQDVHGVEVAYES